MRRILLFPVLLVALGAFASGQGTSDNDKAGGQVENKEVLIKEAQAFADHIEDVKRSGDKQALQSLYADDFICKDERFGIGEVLHKRQFLERRGSPTHGPEDQVVTDSGTGKIKLTHSKVSWLVFGNTVIRTGYSRTVLRHRGRLSKGPRLFTFVYLKQDGHWQIVAEDVFDIPNGYEEPQ